LSEKKKKPKAAATPGKSRPQSGAATPRLRLEWIAAESLTENPRNWRRHPEGQVQAIKDVLADPEIGWAGACLYNERTGRLIDGHARRGAVDPKTPVPVLVGSWSEEAEAKILLTLDPLAAMATPDSAQLKDLLEHVELGTDALKSLGEGLAELVEDADAGEGSGKGNGGAAGPIVDQYKVVISCRDEAHQTELLDRFDQEGLDARALIG
jgi:hypothetical protein